jgi:hypothetical protein
MKISIVILLLTIVGCSEPTIEQPVKQQTEPQIHEQTKSPVHNNHDNGLKFGPQLKFGPRYNFSNGKMEFGPTLHFGPHYNF